MNLPPPPPSIISLLDLYVIMKLLSSIPNVFTVSSFPFPFPFPPLFSPTLSYSPLRHVSAINSFLPLSLSLAVFSSFVYSHISLSLSFFLS